MADAPSSACNTNKEIAMTSVTSSPATAAPMTSTHAPAGGYNLSVGYLRAFITLLVVAHHGDQHLVRQVREL